MANREWINFRIMLFIWEGIEMRETWRTPKASQGFDDESYNEEWAKNGCAFRPSGQLVQLTLDNQVLIRGGQMHSSVEGQLNPDWTEWLMGWPIGWTDLKPMDKTVFEKWKTQMLDGTYWNQDPAELPKNSNGYLSRLTRDNTHRADRLKAIGNGQVPMCILFAVPILDIAQTEIVRHETT